jgi:hypothetical protein
VVEAAVLFRAGEGPAPLPDRRTPEGELESIPVKSTLKFEGLTRGLVPTGLLSGVVRVVSAPTELLEEDEASGVGWRAAYAMAMSYVLEDRRCLREAKKLNDQVHTVTVYQLGPRIFFSAYAPHISCYRHASVLTSEVSMLLAPSSFEPTQDGWKDPPSKSPHIYRDP